MLKLIKTLIIIALAGTCLFIKAGAADTVTINSLIENISGFDNTQVTVEGEAIGEALQRGNYAWVNVNDGTNAIGIWLTIEDAEKIECYGDYKHRGDIVQVTGTFSRNCTEHGGDVDIHCCQIEMISKGYALSEEIEHEKVIAAAILFGAALAVMVAYLMIRRPKPAEDHPMNAQ